MINRIVNHWVKNSDELEPPAHFHAWLIKPYVLSQALKKIATHFQVNVLSQQNERAHPDEYARLAMKEEDVFVRQVFLEGDNIPWTYGRVVIPAQVYQCYFAQLGSLNSKLIGETLLYNNPDVTRSAFEYAALTPSYPLYQIVRHHFSLSDSEPILWARRSVFLMKMNPLLITEIFLPTLPCFPS